ncbi:Probable alpha-mannosidase At5g13980, partial [Durusdinium trenchii]
LAKPVRGWHVSPLEEKNRLVAWRKNARRSSHFGVRFLGGLGMAGLRKMRILWPLVFLLGPVEADPVEVHIVCHTHDDVGWLKTVDEYYSGQNNSIQHAYVHMILDTVVQSLAMNRNRTFTYVEQAFFVRWWRQQDAATRALVKTLVKEGRLEFTNGGWCMHDEAAPHYIDMIDQTTLGHKFLMDEFGVAPRTGWQLDPFGHSATQAALLSAEVGFQGLFFGRIDYQ